MVEFVFLFLIPSFSPYAKNNYNFIRNFNFVKRIMTQNHPNYPLIPDEAFLYFPKETEIVQYKNGHTHRIIFDGGIRYLQEEYTKIS